MRKYVKLSKISEHIDISVKTFKKYVLPFLKQIKINNTIYIDLEELELFLQAREPDAIHLEEILQKIKEKKINIQQMKLKRRENGIYYIFHGQKKISLKTKDEKEAKKIFNQIKKKYTGQSLFEKIEGKKKESNTKRMSEILEEFLEIKKATLSKSSLYRYKLVVDLFIKINGDKDINTYTFKNIEKFKGKRLETVNTSTLNSDLMHLKSFLNFARKSEYLKKDLSGKIEFLKEQKKDRTLTYEEMLKIKDLIWQDYIKENRNNKVIRMNHRISTNYQLYMLYCIYIMSGRRRNEALNLKISDIDFNKGTMKFYNQKAKKYSTVPILDELLEILKEYIEKNKEYILKMNNGKLFTISQVTVNHRLKEYFIRIGRKDVRIHDLRHSFASYLTNQCNVNIQVISTLLDHSDVKITMRYYHKQENVLKEALKNIKFHSN